jgi:hypothetical protein
VRQAGLGALVLVSMVAMAEDQGETYTIDQSRGVDQRVDYQSLTKYGPWDDRNYALTVEDLEYLSPDEEDLHDPIPAFFRVELRKEMPHLRRSGPAQYPRSAVPLFQLRYGELKREVEKSNVDPEPGAKTPCDSDQEK